MKRFLIIVFTLLFIASSYPENKGFSRWSFSSEIGFNKFDGDAVQKLTDPFVTTNNSLTFGANLDYALTPIWGLSLDYLNIPFTGVYTAPLDTFSTKLNNANFNVTVNLTRLVFPKTVSKLYVNGSVGLGLAYYNFNVKQVLNSTTPLEPKYSNAGSIPITLSVEYNINKPLSIGLKARYITFTKDNLEGVKLFQGVSNDHIVMGTVFLTYKFNSKNKNHLRNTKMTEFEPDDFLLLERLNAEKINKLENTLNNFEKIVERQNRWIDSVNVFLANKDGVSDARDLEQNSLPNTPVEFQSSLLKIDVRHSKLKEYIDDIPAVYFDFNKIELDNNALDVIRKIAIKMKADPSLYVEVRGYSDNINNEKQNDLLSQYRSDRVKEELVNYWKIPYNHIITKGKGYVNDPRLKNRQNRRCDFFFCKL